jgi:hypothetical protein
MMLHYQFRRLSSQMLLALTAGAVLLFGAADAITVAAISLLVALLACAWAIRKLTAPYTFAGTSLYLPFGVISAVGIVQLVMGTSAAPMITQQSVALWLVYAAFFVIAVNVQADPTIRTSWITGSCWLALVVGVLAIIQTVVSRGYVLWRAVPAAHSFGPFVDLQYFAILAELLFPVVLIAALESRKHFLFGFAAAAALAAAAAASGSRLGLIVIAIEFTIILIAEVAKLATKRGRVARRIVSSVSGLAIVAAITISAAVLAQMDPTLRDMRIGPVDSGSLGTAAWELFQRRPVTGHGLGAFFAAHDAAYPVAILVGPPGAEPMRFASELGIAGIVAQVLVFGLVLILARTRRAWLAGALPLGAAWVHSWSYGWLDSPALVLVALGVLAVVVADGVRRPLKGIVRPKASKAPATHTHQNHSPQRA